MNEEIKRRNPRPANLRTGRTAPTSPTVAESVDEKFLSFHIGETSFHAGDANGKLAINLSGGLDVEYNATTTEEKNCDTEKEPTEKTITREEYKRLLNSIYGMMEAIDQLKRAVEKLSSNE